LEYFLTEEPIAVNLKGAQAVMAKCTALARRLYLSVVSFIVSNINRNLGSYTTKSCLHIIDVPSFVSQPLPEDMSLLNPQSHGLGRLMVNCLGERILQRFLTDFMEEAFGEHADKLPWEALKQLTRSQMLDLFDEPHEGLLRVLDAKWKDGSVTSDNDLKQSLDKKFGSFGHPLYGKAAPTSPDLTIVLEHFVESVEYELEGSSMFNCLHLGDLLDALETSKGPIASGLLQREDFKASLRGDMQQHTAISYHRAEVAQLMDQEIGYCASIFHVLCCNPELIEKNTAQMEVPRPQSMLSQLKRLGLIAAVNIYFAKTLQGWLVRAPGITETSFVDETMIEQSLAPRPSLDQGYLQEVHLICSETAQLCQVLRDTYSEAARPLEGHMPMEERNRRFQWCLNQKSDQLTKLMVAVKTLLSTHITNITLGSSETYLSGLTLHHLVIFQAAQMKNRIGDMDTEHLGKI